MVSTNSSNSSTTRSTNRPSVAIFDANAPTALAFARSLGRQGISVCVYSHERLPTARISRFVHKFAWCPNPDDADAFLPWLERQLRHGHITLVAPTSDTIAFYLAELAHLGDDTLRRSVAEPTAITTSLLKDRFDDACREQGLHTPRTYFPQSREEAHALADTLIYPIILKPRSHIGVGLARGTVVNDAQSLRTAFRPYPLGSRYARTQYPELQWPMLQRYVTNALDNLYSVSGLIAPDGTLVAVAGSKKVSQWPPTLGVGTLFENWDDDKNVLRGAQMAAQLLGRGLFELELIWDEQLGDFQLIDLNPRAFGQITFDMAREVDLPWLWYQQAVGHPLVVRHARHGSGLWVHSLPYHMGELIGLLRGPDRQSRLSAYVNTLRRPTVDIINDPRDPLPSLLYLAQMLRHPGSLVRPYLAVKNP